MHAVIYTRVSTEEQAREGVSLAAQEAACLDYCRRAGIRVVHTIRDEGESSRTPLLLRPAGAQLTALLASGEIAAVVAHSQSRLFRDEQEAFRMAGAFQDAGVTLHLVDRGGQVDIDSADGLFVYGVTALMDAREVRKLRERVRDAMRHIAHDERRKPGGTPFGYRYVDHKLVAIPEEAEVVREVFQRFAAGAAFAELSCDLNARRVPQKRSGTSWTPATLRYILGNATYLGEIPFRGETLPGDHEALVTLRDWKRCQEIIQARAGNSGRRAVHFGPLFRCGYCGGGLVGTRNTTTDQNAAGPVRRSYAVLRCWRRTHDRGLHEPLQIMERKAMAVVWRHTELLFTGGDIEAAARIATGRHEDGKGRRAQIERRLREIDAGLARSLHLAQAGDIPLDVLERANAPLLSERAELQSEQSGLAAHPSAAVWGKLARADTSRVLRGIRDRGTVEEQLGFLRKLYDEIVARRGELEFHHAGDLLPPAVRTIPPYWRPGRPIGF